MLIYNYFIYMFRKYILLDGDKKEEIDDFGKTVLELEW